jgi:hypothetical protein
MRVFPPLRGGTPPIAAKQATAVTRDNRLMPAYGRQETLTAGSGSGRS